MEWVLLFGFVFLQELLIVFTSTEMSEFRQLSESQNNLNTISGILKKCNTIYQRRFGNIGGSLGRSVGRPVGRWIGESLAGSAATVQYRQM